MKISLAFSELSRTELGYTRKEKFSTLYYSKKRLVYLQRGNAASPPPCLLPGGRLGASWGRPGGVLGASWGRLGAVLGVLGRLGSVCGGGPLKNRF